VRNVIRGGNSGHFGDGTFEAEPPFR